MATPLFGTLITMANMHCFGAATRKEISRNQDLGAFSIKYAQRLFLFKYYDKFPCDGYLPI
jgi:hypothetical protein